jgi:phosphomannomutase
MADVNVVEPGIFKAYDVRGLYPSEVNETAAHDIGGAFVTYLGAKRIAVTRDMRTSSPGLADAFIEGARQQGCDVVDFGMMPTDVMYFAVCRDGLDGGAQITASHNPKQYNGIKLVRREAVPLSGDEGIKEIKEMVLGRNVPPSRPEMGGYERREVLNDYLEHIFGFIDVSVVKPYSCVLDAGSGMAGLVGPRIFERLPCKVSTVAFEPDGTFPFHESNPLIEENRRTVTARVIEEKADIGIAWDGDADRCFFIDGTGDFVAGDFVTALLAEAFLMKQPGQKIIYDVRASYAVKDIVAQYGGEALMSRVGHSFIKQRMRAENAVFGGEVTGHYYFRDNFYADNGFIPALMILDLMSKKGLSLRDLLKPLRERYFISGEINTKVATLSVPDKKIAELTKASAAGNPYDLDGISAEFPDWHFNVRQSNTEPLLRLNLEGLTPEIMEKRRDEVLSIIRG